jgi:hypothetical protein
MEEFWVVWGGRHGNGHVGHHFVMMTMCMTYMPSAIIMVRIYRVVIIQVWSLSSRLKECAEEYICSEKLLWTGFVMCDVVKGSRLPGCDSLSFSD